MLKVDCPMWILVKINRKLYVTSSQVLKLVVLVSTQRPQRCCLSLPMTGPWSAWSLLPRFTQINTFFRIWDARKLGEIPVGRQTDVLSTLTFDDEIIEKYSTKHKGTLVAEHTHGKSVSAAFWDPRGRSILSTCYDDRLRSECSFIHEHGRV